MMFDRILDDKEMNAAFNYIRKVNPKLRSHYLFLDCNNNSESYLFIIDTTAKEYDKLIEYIKTYTSKI